MRAAVPDRALSPATNRRTQRSITAIIATIVLVGSVATIGNASAAAPATADIIVHAGGIRTATSTVGGLGGATFRAVPAGGVGPAVPCVTSAVGTCTITVPPGMAYDVSELAAPAGWYLDPTLDYGTAFAGTPTPYVFRTGKLVGGATVDVPGSSAGGSSSTTSPGSPFSGQLATPLDDPAASTKCGLKIALILDQSGSMNSGTKQTDLKAAAKKVITNLTGTPSQMAIYTFAASTGGNVALTSLGSDAEAAPLRTFIDGLPTPSGGTNWDQGLFQAVTASKQYDLVVVLTDGNPTTDHDGVGNGSQTNFHNVENGIYSANAIKNLGTRLVAIGIGVNGGQDNLRAISGPNLDSDYYLGTTGNFDDVFKQLATGNCDGVLTVQKDIQDFQGNPIQNSQAANGWNFAGSVSAPAATLAFPATATVNGATGFTQTRVTITAGSRPTVTVTEHLTGGYAFVGAVCSVNGTSASTTPAGTAAQPGVSFTAAAGVPLACTFTNKQPPPVSSLAVQKLDATTHLPVAGATFQLFREKTARTRDPALDTSEGMCTTSGNPAQCESGATLIFGTYYWVESAAPTGYVLPSGSARYSDEYVIDAAHTGAPVATLTVSDSQRLSSLAVRKLDEATGGAVDGAQFQLYRETAPGTLNPAGDTPMGTPCTTAGGNTPADTCSASNLGFGTYYWVETAAPAGYVLPAGAAGYSGATTIDAAYAAAGATATVSVNDTEVPSMLTVRKTDEAGTVLPGAIFALWRDTNNQPALQQDGATPDTKIGQCTTGVGGTCSVGGLMFGTYYWVETQAPAFFELPDNPVSAPIVVGPGTAGSTFAMTTFADPSTPVATVAKTVRSTTQNLDGTWTIVYDVTVTNPSAKYATTYELSDSLAFGTGIQVNSATVSAPIGVTPASPPWNGSTHPVIVSEQPLAASTTDDYTVTVTATVATDANHSCDTGGGFGNTSHVALQAGPRSPVRVAATVQGAQDAAACSEPASPTIVKDFISAEQRLVGGFWDGTWDVTYTVAVANPSPTTGLVYSLSDKPAFPADVIVNGGSVTGSDGTDPIAAVAADWNGTSNTVIVTARPLVASGTDTYTVVVNATVPSGADPAELPCTTGGSGHGFFNSATAMSGTDEFTATDCGAIPALPTPTIVKTVTANVQNADGTWTVTYDLAVTNPDPTLASEYDLSDTLAFGQGVTINSATVIGPTGVTVNPDWNGVDKSGIVTQQVVGADSADHYTVTVNASVATAATVTDQDCTLSAGESGTGFLNGATVTLGSQSSTSTACAAPGAPTVVKTVRSVTGGSTAGTWVLSYAVTVSNATASDVTYSLTDDPGLGSGVQITAASASSIRSALDGSRASAPADVAGWTGKAPDDRLAAALALPAGSKDTYTVTLDVTVPSDISDGVLTCSTAGRGHGYFNEAVLTAGADTFPVSACAPIQTLGIEGVTTEVPPVQSRGGGGLAFTGAEVLPQVLLGIGLLTLGMVLLLSVGRRRRDEARTLTE